MIRERLKMLIQYKCEGKQTEFAALMDWSPQYLHRLLNGLSGFGIRPAIKILKRMPEVNARWLLLGEGAMITPDMRKLTGSLLHLLQIEQFLPVMSPEELAKIERGDFSFDILTLEKWKKLSSSF